MPVIGIWVSYVCPAVAFDSEPSVMDIAVMSYAASSGSTSTWACGASIPDISMPTVTSAEQCALRIGQTLGEHHDLIALRLRQILEIRLVPAWDDRGTARVVV